MKYLENYIKVFSKKHKIKDMDSFLDGMKFYKDLLKECNGRECLDLMKSIDSYKYSSGGV